MKKLLILTALFLSLSVSAQIGISLKGGINLSSEKGEETLTSFVPNLGVFYSIKHFKIESGFELSRNGYISSGDWTRIDDYYGVGEIKYTYNYIKIPIILSYKPLNTLFYFAPEIGYCANILIKSEIIINNKSIDLEANKYISSLMCGLKLGYIINDKIDLEIIGRYEMQEINSISILAGINYKF